MADKCFACHGPDESKRDSDLRLDTHEGALAEIDGRHAIVPGKPDESELIRRIASQKADERMPPADSNKQLSAEEIELFRRWIAEGATWREHWAYRAPHGARPLPRCRPARRRPIRSTPSFSPGWPSKSWSPRRRPIERRLSAGSIST